jgi:hypothetical protein
MGGFACNLVDSLTSDFMGGYAGKLRQFDSWLKGTFVWLWKPFHWQVGEHFDRCLHEWS